MGIRETSYYGWQKLNVVNSDAFVQISNVLVNSIRYFNNVLYYAGRLASNIDESNFGILLKSSDKGNSWVLVDRTDAGGNINDVVVDSSGSVYYCRQRNCQ